MTCDLCDRNETILMKDPTSDVELFKRGWMEVTDEDQFPHEICSTCAGIIARAYERVKSLAFGEGE